MMLDDDLAVLPERLLPTILTRLVTFYSQATSQTAHDKYDFFAR
jgi:hypothetical protein